MTQPFNYQNVETLVNPILVGNAGQTAGTSVDSLPAITQFRPGVITQSGTTITGVGTNFTAADVGATLTWADGTQVKITAVGSGTSVTAGTSLTKANPQNFFMSNGGNLPACFAFDVKSSTSTLLPPRMTTTQRLALPPSGTMLPNGSIVYDITIGSLYSYDGGTWSQLGATGGGQILLQPGTAAVPSYSFTTDPTTGMWLAQAGHLDFSANGVNAFEITANGNGHNQLQIVANPNGTSPDLVANGTNGIADPNMDIGLVCQGTGSVSIFGTQSTTGGVDSPGSLKLYNTNDTAWVEITPYEIDNSYTEYYLVRQLTTAQIEAAYATPVLLIGNVANASILITQCSLYMHFDTTPFATGTASKIQYGNTVHGAGTNALGATISDAFMTTTVSGSQLVAPLTAANTAATTTTNVGIYFSNATGAYTGAGANALLTIYMKFIVIPTV